MNESNRTNEKIVKKKENERNNHSNSTAAALHHSWEQPAADCAHLSVRHRTLIYSPPPSLRPSASPPLLLSLPFLYGVSMTALLWQQLPTAEANVSRNRSFRLAASSTYTSLLKVSQKNATMDVFWLYFWQTYSMSEGEKQEKWRQRERETTCDKEYRVLAPFS